MSTVRLWKRVVVTLVLVLFAAVFAWNCGPNDIAGQENLNGDGGNQTDQANTTSTCVHNEDCQAWEKCQNKRCVHPCSEDLDCFGGKKCSNDGICIDSNPDGGNADEDPDGPPGECLSGSTQACYTGPEKTRGIGICKDGQQTCINGRWAACKNDVKPSNEACDSLDNNCDGTVDEGCQTCKPIDLQTLEPGHTNYISFVAFDDAGKMFATSSQDRTLKLWTRDGKLLHDISFPNNQYATRLMFLPGGSIMLALLSNNSMTKIDTTTGKTIGNTLISNMNNSQVYLNSTGEWLIASSYNNEILKVDTKTLKLTKTIKFETRIRYLALANDDNTIAISAGRGKIILWDLKTNKKLREAGTSDLNTRILLFTRDNKELLAIDYRQVTRIKVSSGDKIGQFNQRRSPLFAFTHPDGKHLFVSEYNGNVYQYNIATGAQVNSFASGSLSAMAMSKDGKHILFGLRSGQVLLKKSSGGDPLVNIEKVTYLESNAVAYHPAGTYFATVEARKHIKIWKRDGLKATYSLKGTEDVLSIAFSPDGKTLYAGYYNNEKTVLRSWDWINEKALFNQSKDLGTITALAVSPDGTRLYTASEKNTIDEWNAATGTHLRSMRGHTGPVYSLVVSKDNKQLITGSWDNNVKLWDLATGDPIQGFQGHNDEIYAIALSPDGSLIASGDRKGKIVIWNIQSGAKKHELYGHYGRITRMSFHPNGNTLLSSSHDGTLRLWDVATGTPKIAIPGKRLQMHSVAFSPDGKEILAGGSEGVLLWNCPIQ